MVSRTSRPSVMLQGGGLKIHGSSSVRKSIDSNGILHDIALSVHHAPFNIVMMYEQELWHVGSVLKLTVIAWNVKRARRILTLL